MRQLIEFTEVKSMAKTVQQPRFNDVLSKLGSQRFDVAAAQEGAKRTPNAFQVSKYGCAAIIGAAADGVRISLPDPDGFWAERSPASLTAGTRSF